MFTMAIDQYGQHYDDLGKFPRKALLDILGYKSAIKTYCDTKTGGVIHTGYIIGGLWLNLYTVKQWNKGSRFEDNH